MFLGELRPMCKPNHHAEAMRTPEALTISFHKKSLANAYHIGGA
jgi:hypothetical protein